MRRLLILMLLLASMAACRGSVTTPTQQQLPQPTGTPPSVTATASPPAEPTPVTLTLHIWGPEATDPDGNSPLGSRLSQQIAAFQAADPAVQVLYEPKAIEGPTSIANYLRAAQSAAPQALPDLVLFPTADFESIAQSQLLQPLEGLLTAELRTDLYPFAARDLRINDQWVALPLFVSVSHGATLGSEASRIPTTLAALAQSDPLTWLMGAQPIGEGELADALLIQLIAAAGGMPGPTTPPPRADLLALFQALDAASDSGALPVSILQQADDDAGLLQLLKGGSAQLVQSHSRSFLPARRADPTLVAVQLPTLEGRPAALVEGYLMAITSSQARQQEAAARLLESLLAPEAVAAWGAEGWLPARRSALPAAVSDPAYRALLDTGLSSGWLRPHGSTWGDFARDAQTQFRALLSGQATPEQATDALLSLYPSE